MQKFLHALPRRPEVALLGGHIASLVVWMYTRSFTTLCSALDDKLNERRKKRKHHTPTSEAMLRKKAERSGLTFWAWSGGECWSVKNKKLFEQSEFFLFSGNTCRSSSKSADGEFSLFRFFCSGKRNDVLLRASPKKSSRGLSESKATYLRIWAKQIYCFAIFCYNM